MSGRRARLTRAERLLELTNGRAPVTYAELNRKMMDELAELRGAARRLNGTCNVLMAMILRHTPLPFREELAGVDLARPGEVETTIERLPSGIRVTIVPKSGIITPTQTPHAGLVLLAPIEK